MKETLYQHKSHEYIVWSVFLKVFLMFINPTASALDSRDSGPTLFGMGPLHENDVFRVALSVWHENRNRWRVFGKPRRRVSSTPTGMSYGYKYAIKTTPDLRF